MLANFHLRTRILIGYTIPFFLLVVLGGIVLYSADNVNEAFRQTDISKDAIIEVGNLAQASARMARSSRGYILIQDESLLRDYESALTLYRDSVENIYQIIEEQEQRSNLSRIQDLGRQLDEIYRQTINLVKQGEIKQATELIERAEAREILSQIEELQQEFSQLEKRILAQSTQKAEGAIAFLSFAILGGLLLSIVVGLTAAVLISSGISQTINKAVDAIASSSEEIAQTIVDQQRITNQQANSVNQTTTTMDELGASSRTTAEQAELVATGARKALDLSEIGTQAVEQSQDGMSILEETVGAIADKIRRLSEQTGEIRNISTLVSDIANQTNMLALNAAVEAVRAGEHGKGFGVVAGEIRKLADQSKKSADKINVLVGEIQGMINSTVIATEEGTKTVRSGVKIARETANAFGGVTQAIDDVVVSSQQISLTAQQQAIAIQQVVEAMNAINRGSKETSAGMSQTKLGTEKLKAAAIDLKGVV